MKVLNNNIYYCTCVLASDEYCVKVINKPCVIEAEYMHLIPWTHHRGSEQVLPGTVGELVQQGHSLVCTTKRELVHLGQICIQ